MTQEELDAQRRKLAQEYPELLDSFAMSVVGAVFETHGGSAEAVAKMAYGIARAMMIERAKS